MPLGWVSLALFDHREYLVQVSLRSGDGQSNETEGMNESARGRKSEIWRHTGTKRSETPWEGLTDDQLIIRNSGVYLGEW